MGRIMWWHADLPQPPARPEAAHTPPEPEASGEFLLEWILPSLREDAETRRSVRLPDPQPRRRAGTRR